MTKPSEQDGKRKGKIKTCRFAITYTYENKQSAETNAIDTSQFLTFFLDGSPDDSAAAGSDLGSDFGFVLEEFTAAVDPSC